MEARGDQKIHTFYCWRLKESTPASCHCLQCCCALVCVSVCVVVGETGLYTTCSYQRVAVLEAGSKSGTTHSLDLTLRSFCQPPPAIKNVDRMTAWNLACARRCAHDTKEARLARQQALALAARARASQTTEACAWAHRLSLRGLQQVSVNQGLVIAGKKIYEGSTCSAGARASRTTEACAWVYLASGSRTRLLIVSSATGKIQIQGLWRHCVTIFAEAWKRGGIRKSTLFIAGG